MTKYYSPVHRLGTVTIVPQKPIMTDSGIKQQDGLKIKLMPSWIGGFDPIEKKFEDPGPECIDTDKMEPGNIQALESFWGGEWKKKLIEWIETVGKRSFGFVEGDPDRFRKIHVTVSPDEYAEVMKLRGKPKTPLPDVQYSEEQGPGVQRITTGVKTAKG